MRGGLPASIARLVLAASLLPAGSPARAQSTAGQPQPDCSAPEHRQFDFWVGTWDVTTQGKPAGTNRITSELQGCVLVENWTSARGGSGMSLNFYDRATRRWQQTWMDQSGNPLHLSGGLQNARMVMQNAPGPEPSAGLQRITWSREGDGRVRQLWEASKDGGKTWTPVFDGTYTRKANAP